MLPRVITPVLKRYARQFRSLAVVGPRQSGKSTLVKNMFSRKPYVSLEDPDIRLLATNDPRSFLNQYKNGAVIDEAQRVPELFNYMQGILDAKKKDGFYILTGSNNFLLQSSISQSLAGRIGYLDLLPLSYSEILEFDKKQRSANELIWTGCYPEIYDKKRNPAIWYASYVRTYIERDVKQLRNIENTILFNKFLQLCAGRCGQQLNISALSVEAGIDMKTVQSWLALLQSSYIVHLLPPYHNNFNKRITKTPKLYFIDTGLACFLLGIKKYQELRQSHFRGALFENYIIMEFLKKNYNHGKPVNMYYWRESNGLEIDLIIDDGKKLLPVEIKSGQTFQETFMKNIRQWNALTNNKKGLVIYDGDMEFVSKEKIMVANWKKYFSTASSKF